MNSFTAYLMKTIAGPENIQKSDVGSVFQYTHPTKPYALTGIETTTALVPQVLQEVSYTSFEQPSVITESPYQATFLYNSDEQRARMEVKQNGSTILTRWYAGSRYMKETAGSTTREYTWIGGDAYTAPCVAVKTNTGSQIYYYLLRDYLGNITHQVNMSNTVVAEYSFDSWGRRRDKDDWTYNLVGEPELLAGRGFTGHEWLPWFNLYNMNGRLYDPAVGRFLSPDNYVQMPDNTQNFNRYSYCLNNPLRYTDPTGEIFGTIFGAISDLVNNIFVRTFKGDNWDWTQTKLGWEIDKGLFHTDQNKSPGGRIWEFISRFTWQLPQIVVGDLFVSGANAFGQVNSVTHNYGMTAVDMGLDNGAVTIGNYTAGPKGYKADWKDHLFVHEYGHYIQSQQHGPVYLFTVGIPSAILQTRNPNSPRHDDRWFEADASYKAAAYFDKHYGSKKGYVLNSPDYFNKTSFVKGGYSPYLNPRTKSYYQYGNPISGKFHWTDPIIYIPILGLFPSLFY